ncbi:hypothetical protein TNCV_1635231 [Trichonephila clavipes]|nr:hypothetical protein TNCV_1635231 [Trichonephila clavipes]
MHAHNFATSPDSRVGQSVGLNFLRSRVLDESDHSLECILVISRIFPECIKAEFIASWACSPVRCCIELPALE